MRIASRHVDYSHGGAALQGYFAIDATQFGPRPAVLVSHAWAGCTEFEHRWADRLAGLGYAGFAIDNYGKGVVGKSPDENRALMTPLVEDRGKLQARMQAAVEAVKTQPEVDATRIAAIGFCFGGLCVLDLARAGADIRGVASFHGLFTPPGNTKGRKIKAKVAAFHGFDDPMVPHQAIIDLGIELKDAGADWQIHAYGGVMHSFTNPEANDPAFGTVWDRRAADRSWASLQVFLKECFA
ncbi:MAG: dienelactone hydrolase family protein [Parvularculaceae bacterium]|nr:dienelactone hydrolase family protein [Parvularculaceae bacterium]